MEKRYPVEMTNVRFKFIGGEIDLNNLGLFDGEELERKLDYPFPEHNSAKHVEYALIDGVRLNEAHDQNRLRLDAADVGLTSLQKLRFIAHFTLEARFVKDLRRSDVSFSPPKTQEATLFRFIKIKDEVNIFFVMDYAYEEKLICIEVDPLKDKSYRLVHINRSQATFSHWEFLDLPPIRSKYIRG